MKPVKEYRIDQMFDNSIWYLWQAGENIKTGSLMEIFSYLNALESNTVWWWCGYYECRVCQKICDKNRSERIRTCVRCDKNRELTNFLSPAPAPAS